MADRIILAKASLEGIFSHIMSYIKLPTKINKVIDRAIRDFL